MITRIDITDEGIEVIKVLQVAHGELLFHISGGCCDGSAPMCLPKDELLITEMDIKLGTVCDVDVFIAQDQFEYLKHSHLTLDVVRGRGSSFSLEIPLGVRFVLKSRLFSEAEQSSISSYEMTQTGIL